MVDATVGATTTAGAASTGPTASNAELTCNTCVTTFESKEVKREHMKSDWHVHNLKRRIASLSPVSLVTFEENVVDPKTEDLDSDGSSQFKKQGTRNDEGNIKRKTRRSRFKAQDRIPKPAEPPSADIPPPSDSEESDSADEEEEFNPRQCLFCNSQASSLDANMTHMSQAHSFFIPYVEHLIDLESFLNYLSIILSDFYECLYCGSVKSNKFAVQDHMRDKGHCKVKDLEDEGHALKDFYDFGSDVDSDEESREGEEDATLAAGEDELRLPSGKTLGHRSRARTSRQRVPVRASSRSPSPWKFLTEGEPEEPPTEEVPSRDRRMVMRAGTFTSMIGIPEVQRRALVLVEQKMMKIEARRRNEYEAHVQRKANQQKRFRVKSIGKKAGGLEKRLG